MNPAAMRWVRRVPLPVIDRLGAGVPEPAIPTLADLTGGWRLDASIFRRATVWPEVGVASVAGVVVEDTTVDPRLLASYRRRRRLRRFLVLPFPGLVTALNVGSSHKGYFHQWFEMLPRAWALSQLDANLPRLTVVVTQHLSPELERVLRAFLPDDARLLRVPRWLRLRPMGGYLHTPVPFRAHWPVTAKVPSKQLPDQYLDDFTQTVTTLFRLDDSQPSGDIYISRREAKSRHIQNDDEVSSMLASIGVKTLVLEDMAVVDQARSFHGANLVIAQHGAALTNLLYCKPGTRVIEIFAGPSGGAHSLYQSIALQLGLDYQALLLDGEGKDSTVTLPLVDLERIVKNHGPGATFAKGLDPDRADAQADQHPC